MTPEHRLHVPVSGHKKAEKGGHVGLMVHAPRPTQEQPCCLRSQEAVP